MAFDIQANGNYGSGKQGSVSAPPAQINSYAQVTAVSASTITIGKTSNGGYGAIAAGTEVMIHVTASKGTASAMLGRYIVATVSSVSGSNIVLSKNIGAEITTDVINSYYVQAILIPQFVDLNLKDKTVSPPAFDTSTGVGGVLAIKCSGTLTLGVIDLDDKGIPDAANRPLTTQESQGMGDFDTYACWENHLAEKYLTVQNGNGAAWIVAKAVVFNENTKIGGTAAGTQYSRGARKGGATISIVAPTINNFSPSCISTAKGTGAGLGRCYIATGTKLRNDEALYAVDCISDHTRKLKLANFMALGNGANGNVTNPTAPMNSYAYVLSVGDDGKTITIENATTNGIGAFKANGMIMFHVSKQKLAYMDYLGCFCLTRATSVTGTTQVVLSESVAKIIPLDQIQNYHCQLIAVPEFNNLTINTNYTATPQYDTTTHVGGICALLVAGNLDLTNGKINVEGKGNTPAYGEDGLERFGNAQDCDRLPIGAGHGSVFVMARLIKGNANSRIGATYSGSNLGGAGGAGGAGMTIGSGSGGTGGSARSGGAGGSGGTTSANEGQGGKGGGGYENGHAGDAAREEAEGSEGQNGGGGGAGYGGGGHGGRGGGASRAAAGDGPDSRDGGHGGRGGYCRTMGRRDSMGNMTSTYVGSNGGNGGRGGDSGRSGNGGSSGASSGGAGGAGGVGGIGSGGGAGGNGGNGGRGGAGGSGGRGGWAGDGGNGGDSGNPYERETQSSSGYYSYSYYSGGRGGDGSRGANGGAGGRGGYGGRGGTGGVGGAGGPGGYANYPYAGGNGGAGGAGASGGSGGNGGDGKGGCDGSPGEDAYEKNGSYYSGSSGKSGSLYSHSTAGGNGGDGGPGGNGGAGGAGGASGNGGNGTSGSDNRSGGGNGGQGKQPGWPTDQTGVDYETKYPSAGANGESVTKQADNGRDGAAGPTPEVMTRVRASSPGLLQGAHLMIIAGQMSGINLSAISTGGAGATSTDSEAGWTGWAFIYCNRVVNSNKVGVVI